MNEIVPVRRFGGTLIAIGLLACAALPALVAQVPAVAEALAGARLQLPALADDRLAGLEWTFVRIRYSSPNDLLQQFRRTYWSDPWAIDAPAAEQNLTRRLATVTSIKTSDPVVLTLGDEKLWEYPWIYFVEPANLEIQEKELPILREYLLRGGTATFDDFHGPIEWDLFTRQMTRLFPDREIIDLPPDHAVFHCFYDIDKYPQTPGLGSFFNGVTWEKGGYEAKLRAILDDRGRAMVLINFNTDMGDGWEWSNAEDYPGYIKYTATAYRMMINEIVYALTH